jgi:hypothetical protein
LKIFLNIGNKQRHKKRLAKAGKTSEKKSEQKQVAVLPD